ncbi:hypothetical protein Tco_1509830 [Tanacetum coccineum]
MDTLSSQSTLRDEIARAFAKDVYDQMERPVFIAVSICDLSKYEGLQLSATPTIYHYLNPYIPDVEAIRDQYRAQLNLNEPLDISEERCLDLDQEKNRNRFALATESRRAVRFTCEGTIIGINTARDWYYKFCSKCIRKVPSRTSTIYFEVALAEADSNRRRKESDEPKDAPTGRDDLNENPSHDELMAVSDIAKPVTTSLARMCKYQNPHQNSESEKVGILVLNCYAKNWLSDVIGDMKEEVAAKRKDKIADSKHDENGIKVSITGKKGSRMNKIENASRDVEDESQGLDDESQGLDDESQGLDDGS